MSSFSVTVVVVSYNNSEVISRSLRSIFGQRSKIDNIVIVDGGSIDATMLILSDIKGRDNVSIINHDSKNLYELLNVGIESTDSQYVLPIIAGDFLKPEYVGKCRKTAIREEGDVVFTDVWSVLGRSGIYIDFIDKNNMKNKNCVTPTALIKKEVWENVGGYKEADNIKQSVWDFWLKCVELKVKMVRLPDALFCYNNRVSENYDVTGDIK